MWSQRFEMSCNVLSLFHSSNNISIHWFECRVVGAVCQVQDAGHLDGGVGLHLQQPVTIILFQILTCSNKLSRLIHLASQKLISVIGPGVLPSLISSALSLLSTSSTFNYNIDIEVFFDGMFMIRGHVGNHRSWWENLFWLATLLGLLL